MNRTTRLVTTNSSTLPALASHLSPMDPAQTINRLKQLLAGKWAGEGFAQFPTIEATAYTERTEFRPDELKDSIFFEQKTWYKNDTPQNGHTVFWDTGFILLRDDHILLHSAQVGGRIEQYRLTESSANRFVFDTTAIPVMCIRWWIKFGSIQTDDADFPRAKRTAIVVNVIGALLLLGIVGPHIYVRGHQF